MPRARHRPLTRDETLIAFRRLVRERRTVTTAWLHDHHRPLLYAAIRHFGSLAYARAAAGMGAPVFPAKWSRKRVVEELRAIHEGGGATRFSDLVEQDRFDLAAAIQLHAGGIRNARRLARVPDPPIRHSDQERWDQLEVVVQILDRLADGLSVAASKVPSKLYRAGRRHFGSWRAAIEAAGLRDEDVRLRRDAYSREELIQLLRSLARERPTMTWGELHEHPAETAFLREFGGARRAVAAAGIKGWPQSRHQSWSRARVLRALRSRAEYQSSALPTALHDACKVYFGSVPAARAAAGLPALRSSWSKERVIAELKALAAQAKYTLDRNLKAACERLFGSVTAARHAARVPATKPATWSRERVIAMIQERAASGDLTISGRLADACSRYFGSVPAARRAAGVPTSQRQDAIAKPILTTGDVSPATADRAAIPDSFILDALRGRARAAGWLSTEDVDRELAALARERFGSVEAAIHLARIPTQAPTRKAPREPATVKAADDRTRVKSVDARRPDSPTGRAASAWVAAAIDAANRDVAIRDARSRRRRASTRAPSHPN